MATVQAMKMVAIADIVILDELQTRLRVSEKHVDEIAKAMDDGSEVPAVDLFEDTEGRSLLADGWHRVLAATKIGRAKIEAVIHKDSPETAMTDALLFSIERNGRHGLNWTVEDRKKAVAMALKDKVLRRKSDKFLAQKCGCSPGLVAKIRENGGEAPAKKTPAKKAPEQQPAPAPARKREPTPAQDANASAVAGEETLAPPVMAGGSRHDQAVQTLKDWVSSGVLEWADIKAVLMQDDPKCTPLRMPAFPIHARVLEGSEVKLTLDIIHIGTLIDGDRTVVEIATRPKNVK